MTALAQVIRIKPWRKNQLCAPTEPRIPEPQQLYSLIALALVRHVPAHGGECRQCSLTWPCPQIRLAYRLREGF